MMLFLSVCLCLRVCVCSPSARNPCSTQQHATCLLHWKGNESAAGVWRNGPLVNADVWWMNQFHSILVFALAFVWLRISLLCTIHAPPLQIHLTNPISKYHFELWHISFVFAHCSNPQTTYPILERYLTQSTFKCSQPFRTVIIISIMS